MGEWEAVDSYDEGFTMRDGLRVAGATVLVGLMALAGFAVMFVFAAVPGVLLMLLEGAVR